MDYEQLDTNELINIIDDLKKRTKDLYQTNFELRKRLDEHTEDHKIHENYYWDYEEHNDSLTERDKQLESIHESLTKIMSEQHYFFNKLFEFSMYTSHRSTDSVIDHAKELQNSIDSLNDSLDEHIREHNRYDSTLDEYKRYIKEQVSNGRTLHYTKGLLDTVMVEIRPQDNTLYSIKELLEENGFRYLFVVRESWFGDFCFHVERADNKYAYGTQYLDGDLYKEDVRFDINIKEFRLFSGPTKDSIIEYLESESSSNNESKE